MMNEPPKNNYDQSEVEFEDEMRKIFAREQAPSTLKSKILSGRNTAIERKSVGTILPKQIFTWHLALRLAATILLAVGVGGALIWHRYDQERKAEQARQKLYLALQITNHAIHHVQDRLAHKSQPHE
jgi:hypothetical protein